MSKVAYIGRVQSVNAIPDADRIESLEVVCGLGGKWRGTAVKGSFSEGDVCEVYLQDALLPPNERYGFMEKHHWRVRMMRLRGVPSECLIMPVTEITDGLAVGTDIADMYGITKYEKPVPAQIAGDIAGNFPSFIPKTDEPNFQTAPHLVEALVGNEYYITVKADGSSGTAYWHEGSLHCCSRNWELKDNPSTAAWILARKYNLHRLSEIQQYAIQFEIVGPRIQGNAMGLDDIDMRVFNVYDIEEQEYAGWEDVISVCQFLGVPTVNVTQSGYYFPAYSEDDLRKLAEVRYENGAHAEGIVVRPTESMRINGERVSFKVINLLYRERD